MSGFYANECTFISPNRPSNFEWVLNQANHHFGPRVSPFFRHNKVSFNWNLVLCSTAVRRYLERTENMADPAILLACVCSEFGTSFSVQECDIYRLLVLLVYEDARFVLSINIILFHKKCLFIWTGFLQVLFSFLLYTDIW